MPFCFFGKTDSRRDESPSPARLSPEHWLVQRCPDPAAKTPFTLELPTTKRVLAAELGTVSETLSRTLAKFRSQQLLTVKGRTVTVLSPARLKAVIHRPAHSKAVSGEWGLLEKAKCPASASSAAKRNLRK